MCSEVSNYHTLSGSVPYALAQRKNPNPNSKTRERLFVNLSKANRNSLTLSNITQSCFLYTIRLFTFYYPILELLR